MWAGVLTAFEPIVGRKESRDNGEVLRLTGERIGADAASGQPWPKRGFDPAHMRMMIALGGKNSASSS